MHQNGEINLDKFRSLIWEPIIKKTYDDIAHKINHSKQLNDERMVSVFDEYKDIRAYMIENFLETDRIDRHKISAAIIKAILLNDLFSTPLRLTRDEKKIGLEIYANEILALISGQSIIKKFMLESAMDDKRYSTYSLIEKYGLIYPGTKHIGNIVDGFEYFVMLLYRCRIKNEKPANGESNIIIGTKKKKEEVYKCLNIELLSFIMFLIEEYSLSQFEKHIIAKNYKRER